MSVKVLVDTGDIYHKLYRQFGYKLDYGKYLARIEELCGPVKDAIAYGSQINNEAAGFITCLKGLGFHTKFKRPRIFKISDREIKQCSWGVDITLDAFTNDNDIVILGISNTDYIPLIQALQERETYVIVFAASIPNIIRKVADKVIEITPDLLEETQDED